MKRWIVPIVVLPGTVLVFVPILILWFSGEGGTSGQGPLSFILRIPLTVAFALIGQWLAFGAMKMFFQHGEGTAAPWDPPARFVVRGVYRHVRNPMITGVILLLIAEAIYFQSWPLAIWAGIFFLGNAVYFPLVEEPGLRKRFGDDYRVYCENVGRWIPGAAPWTPPWEGADREAGVEQD